MNSLCPCHSQLSYDLCCAPYHEGKPCPDALALMRSRYSAYAKKLPFYIIQTTDPDNPSYEADYFSWSCSIKSFCDSHIFENLEVLCFKEKNDQAWVHFKAYLKEDTPFILEEKSFFRKKAGKWLYTNGELI